jgi:hypothetical protein
MNRRLSIGMGITVLGIIATFAVFVVGPWTNTEDAPSRQVAGRSGQLVPQEDSERPTRRSVFARTEDVADRIDQHVDWIIESGILNDDREASRIVRMQISNLQSETLAKLCSASPAMRLYIMKEVASSKDVGFVRSFLSFVSKDAEISASFLQHLGSDSPLLAPDQLEATLEILELDSDDHREQLGRGIAGRVAEIKDLDERLEAVNSYYQSTDNYHLLKFLSYEAVQLMDTNEAAEWLVGGPAALVEHGDAAYIQSMNANSLDPAISFINRLVELEQVDRAQRNIENVVSKYAPQDPAAAMAWVATLDGELVTSQAYLTAFAQLHSVDPDTALRLAATTQEAKARRVFENYIRALNARGDVDPEK